MQTQLGSEQQQQQQALRYLYQQLTVGEGGRGVCTSNGSRSTPATANGQGQKHRDADRN